MIANDDSRVALTRNCLYYNANFVIYDLRAAVRVASCFDHDHRFINITSVIYNYASALQTEPQPLVS